MRSRLSLILCFVAAVLVLAACSSTTVVSSDNRPSASESADEDTAEAETSDSADESTADEDEATGEDVDAERGARDDENDEAAADEPQTPRELEEAGGFGLGGAEQLGGLLADCESGSDLACDILFQLSNFDSVEEAAALTCGGRSDVEVLFCTDDIDAEPEQLVFSVSSPGLDRVVTECEIDGNMTACDFLYFRSPVGSELEEVGATCGGRVDVAVPDCRTFLADS